MTDFYASRYDRNIEEEKSASLTNALAKSGAWLSLTIGHQRPINRSETIRG